MQFSKSIVALVTPFKNGQLDLTSFGHLIEWHIESGTSGLVICGTTGESMLLTTQEQHILIAAAVEASSKRIPIIAGTGLQGTQTTIEATQKAKDLGADAALVVTPYYIRPSQEGLYEHYKALNETVDFPIIVYNNPSRAAVELSVSTLINLSRLENIIGVKDATGKLNLPVDIKRDAAKGFIQLSGNDNTVAAYLAQGGHGCISTSANIAPKEFAAFHQAWADQDLAKFTELRDCIHPLHDAAFCAPSPAPTKYALSLLGKCSAEVRAPMVELSNESKKAVQMAMAHIGLVQKEKVVGKIA
jgi:4-hydroxy-tetrahydrodipicolinate synthase